MVIEKLQKLTAVDIKMILIGIEAGQLTVKNMACLLNVSGIFMPEAMIRRRLDKLVRLGIFGKKKRKVELFKGCKKEVVYFVKEKYVSNRKFVETVMKLWEDLMNWHK